MADKKISQLTAASTPLAGTEVLPIVQSSTTKQVSVANLTAGRAISATQLTLSTGNLIVANGQGIDFSATPNTGTSELLNDYEEGAFTPTISGSVSAGTGTYASQTGTYTKIGNLVTATAYVNISNHTGTGDILLSGLPFTAYATSDFYFPVTIGYLNNCAMNANSYPAGFMVFNTTSILLQQGVIGGGSMNGVPMDTAFSIMYTITYRAA